jgi:endo-1,4-beta-D-glucanase Y
MRNMYWALSTIVLVGCMVDGTAQPASNDDGSGTGASSSSSGQPGSAGSSNPSAGGSVNTGMGGASSVTAGTTSSAGTVATGGTGTGGSGTGTGGSNAPIEGGGSGTEKNPGMGSGFFPATLLPSHAKTAYTTWKTKYLKPCNDGKFRVAYNASETVSEGIGYGMLLTVAHGDRPEFDGLWAYFKQHSSGGVMAWKVSGCDSVVDGNSASDADLDAAMALIQASCKWGGSYLAEAQTLIAAVKSKETIEGGENFLKPASSGLDSCQNVSYASPAYYRAFAKKKPDQAAFWNKLASDSYLQLARTDNDSTGLVPNWSNMSGGAGCGGKPDGDRYGYDAARTPWRVATDYVWHGTPAAKDYLGKLVTWVDGPAGGITAIGDMYTLAGAKEGLNHNSTFTGAFALAGMAHSQAKADLYGTAFKSISDGAYYEESLRAVYMLLASGLFLNACD